MKRDEAAPSGNREPGWGSDVAAEMLRRLGIKYITNNPGSSFRGLHDSIVNFSGNTDPSLLLCLNENQAIAIAHGYANASEDGWQCDPRNYDGRRVAAKFIECTVGPYLHRPETANYFKLSPRDLPIQADPDVTVLRLLEEVSATCRRCAREQRAELQSTPVGAGAGQGAHGWSTDRLIVADGPEPRRTLTPFGKQAPRLSPWRAAPPVDRRSGRHSRQIPCARG